MTEADIMHEAGDYWVARQRGSYTVFRNIGTHSTSLAAFKRDGDGLSLAIAYANYNAKRLASLRKNPTFQP